MVSTKNDAVETKKTLNVAFRHIELWWPLHTQSLISQKVTISPKIFLYGLVAYTFGHRPLRFGMRSSFYRAFKLTKFHRNLRPWLQVQNLDGLTWIDPVTTRFWRRLKFRTNYQSQDMLDDPHAFRSVVRWSLRSSSIPDLGFSCGKGAKDETLQNPSKTQQNPPDFPPDFKTLQMPNSSL